MNESRRQDQGYQKTTPSTRNLRHRNAGISNIVLIVAIATLMSTKSVAAFMPILNVKPFPAASITRFTDRIASHGSVRYQSGYRRRSKVSATDGDHNTPPILVSEGLFAVDKPLEWTSQDVVSFIRGMFERDARSRGANPGKIGSKKNRHLPVVRVGHGGTLDPLATGVLVLGLGSGTKSLQR